MIDNYRFWILGLFFLFVVNINGQNRAKSVSIDQLPSHTVIDNYLEVYTGKANSPTEIDSSKASFFKPYSWDSIPEGKSVVWLKLSIDNPLNYDYQLVLGNNQFQFLEFYEPVENDNYHVELSGTLCDHSQMQIVQGANSWFSFNVPAKSNKHFYIRASNNQKIKYQYSRQPFTLYSYSEFSVYKKKQTFFNYFFWGALVIITFYNFILYFQLRSKIYLFYVVNNIGILLFVLAQSGLISELFFSNSKHYENLLLILGNLAFIFYVLFCKEFLEFKKNRQKLNTILNKLLFFWPAPLLLILVNQAEIAVAIGGVTAIWVYTVIMVNAYRNIKNGENGALFFFIANLFYYVGIIVSILQIGQILPVVFLGLNSVNFVQIGTMLQVSLFSLTVGFRIIKMQNEIIEKQLEQERFKTEEEQKRRKLIEEQNMILEQKVNERTAQLKNNNQQLIKQSEILEYQKMLVEEKQKEIIDSINYAKRIQYTLLANDNLLNKHLPEFFVLFKPKDIVSGDFYWAIEKDDKFYLAVCDCTGHGVPGAFMSLLNISFLNEAISEKGILEPHKILNYVRQRLEVTQKNAKDGMDGTLICFTANTNRVTYASAYNKPVLIRDNICTILKADKMPVGRSDKKESFSLFEIDIKTGDKLYFYTDGYADQFGGINSKKFKYAPLNELILNTSNNSADEQRKILLDEFYTWKGREEQVDDICLIGMHF